MATNPPYRPPKYSDPSEMEPIINAYFEKCDEGREYIVKKGNQNIAVYKRSPYTWVGLALALGFESRQSLWAYCNRNKHEDDIKAKGFGYIITCAKARIEDQNLAGAMSGEYDTRITALTLSANHGYATKTESKVDIKGSVSLEERLLRAEKEEGDGNHGT